MKLINLTPHDLHLVNGAGAVITIPRSGRVARVIARHVVTGHMDLDGIQFPVSTWEQESRVVVKGPGNERPFPRPLDGVKYVVSTIVKSTPWMIDRRDVLVPGELLRDEKGRIKGTTSLCDFINYI